MALHDTRVKLLRHHWHRGPRGGFLCITKRTQKIPRVGSTGIVVVDFLPIEQMEVCARNRRGATV